MISRLTIILSMFAHTKNGHWNSILLHLLISVISVLKSCKLQYIASPCIEKVITRPLKHISCCVSGDVSNLMTAVYSYASLNNATLDCDVYLCC